MVWVLDMKKMSHNNIFYAIDSLEINNKIDAYYELSPFNANRRMWHLEREAGAKNSDFMVIMGINRLSMKRGIEWAAQM